MSDRLQGDNPIHTKWTLLLPNGGYHNGGGGQPRWRTISFTVHDYGRLNMDGVQGRTQHFVCEDHAFAYCAMLEEWYRGVTP